ncbi:hypothetical protein [Luteibacter sp. RCC_6_2]|uniref:hypothetical protein n=1 Tax=Luteibacter sp. RCC_6_2 TaxID=3239223 RepID=UPI003523F52F
MNDTDYRLIDATLIKLVHEAGKLSAETSKLSAETARIQAESRYYPMIALGTLAVGVLGGVTALIACLIRLAF